MKRYAPDAPPRGATPDQLADYLWRELTRVTDAINQIVDLDKDYVAPPRLIDGMIRYADGVTWNPDAEHGEGFYGYWDGEWHYLACCDEGGGGGGCCWTDHASHTGSVTLNPETPDLICQIDFPIPEDACSVLVNAAISVEMWPSDSCPPTEVTFKLYYKDPNEATGYLCGEQKVRIPSYTVDVCDDLSYPAIWSVALTGRQILANVAEPAYSKYSYWIEVEYVSDLTDIQPVVWACLTGGLFPCTGYQPV